MLACVVLILGFTGMAAQTLLLRELLTVFSGSELVIGCIFGIWMSGEAFGSLVAGMVCKRPNRAASQYILATLLFVSMFPVAVSLARIGKGLIGIPADMVPGTGSIFLISSVVILPIAFVHGFQFIVSVAMARDTFSGSGDAVARLYSLETLGSIAGGAATSLLLFPLLDSFRTAAMFAVMNAGACLWLLISTGCRSPIRRGLALLAAGTAILLLAGGLTKTVQEATVARQWGGKRPLVHRNSHYQNIVVMEAAGQYTLFTDGRAILSIPDPDVAYLEEFVHLPMLCHPEPRDILVLGGAGGGVIGELLKHPSVRRIDYLESDPAILATVRALPIGGLSSDLADPRVSLVYADAGAFVRECRRHYDVVLANFPLPETLQTNRFFTTGFYGGLSRLTADGGIVSVPAAGSLTYYSQELGSINATLLATLRASFPKVDLAPGDTNYYLAGSRESLKGLDPAVLARRLGERGLKTRLVSPEQLDYRFAAEGREWAIDRITRFTGSLNRDNDPKLMYLQLGYRSIMHGSPVSGILRMAQRLDLSDVAAAIAAVTAAAFPLVRSGRQRGVAIAVAGTGISAMFGELLLLYSFQVGYGSLFHSVGLLLALFMTGIAVGSRLAEIPLVRSFSDADLLLWLETMSIALFLALAAYFALVGRDHFATGSLPVIVAGMLLVGMITGMTYPVASRQYAATGIASGNGMPVQGAGVIYSADLLGGCLGGVAGAFLLLPGLGIVGSFLALSMVKGGTLVLLACSRVR